MRPSQPFGERIVVVVVNGCANIGRLVWDLMRKKLEWPNYLQSDRADPDGDRKDGGDGKKVRTASILINQSHWDPTISTEKVHLGDKRKVQLKNKNF